MVHFLCISFLVGGKELRTFGLDVASGHMKYECGMEGCKSPSTADLTSKEDSSGIVLVIKKQLQTVRAIDSLTGTERWNFSVGTHELALAGVTEGCYEPAEDSESAPSHEGPINLFRMAIPEGIIFGADAQNKAVWQHKVRNIPFTIYHLYLDWIETFNF
jgi:translation initiation factor 2-alpha kinase 3